MRTKRFLTAFSLSLVITVGIGIVQDMKADPIPIPETHKFHLTDSTITQRTPCTECHTDSAGGSLKPKAIFNHSSGFMRNHRFFAAQDNQLCSSCHRQSDCADCHANQADLKPSFKRFDAPERASPHRGNYLFQHRVDGRIDPTPCYRCHGRQNNTLCRNCHR